jgi:hypothetical protein
MMQADANFTENPNTEKWQRKASQELEVLRCLLTLEVSLEVCPKLAAYFLPCHALVAQRKRSGPKLG